MFNSLFSSLSPSQPTSSSAGVKKKRHRRKKSKNLDSKPRDDNDDTNDSDNDDDDEDMSLENLVKNMKMGGKNETYSSLSSPSNKLHAAVTRHIDVESTLMTLAQDTPPPPPPPPELSPERFCTLCFQSFKSSVQHSISTAQTNQDSDMASPAPAYVRTGLLNTGNTCFMNCVLQSLLNIDPFLRCVNDIRHHCQIPLQLPSELPIWKEFLTFLNSVMLSEAVVVGSSSGIVSDSSAAIAPTEFLCSLVEQFRMKYSNTLSSSSVSESSSSSSNSACGRRTLTLDAYVAPKCDSNGQILTSHEIPQSNGVHKASCNNTSGSNGHQQADAMEFFTFLLDSLHEEMRMVGGDSPAWLRDELGYGQNKEMENNSVLASTYGNEDNDVWEEVGKGKIKINIDEKQSKQVASDVIQSSVISQTFHGSLRSTVIYEKKKTTSITYQRFHCLPLDIRGGAARKSHYNTNVTLSDALKNFFKEEILNMDRLNRITKILTMEHAPRRLILHLKRFQYDHTSHNSVKIQTPVSFEPVLHIPQSCLSQDLQSKLRTRALHQESLKPVTSPETTSDSTSTDLPQPTKSSRKARRKRNAEANKAAAMASALPMRHVPGMTPRPAQNNSKDKTPEKSVPDEPGLKYELQSIVLHHGNSAHSGHYTCLVRRPIVSSNGNRSEWMHFDDHNISTVTENFVFQSVQSQAYILFYGLLE